MKLQELAAKPTEQYSRVFESHFDSHMNFERIPGHKAQHMLGRVRALIKEHRQSPDRYRSEQDPGYLKLVMLEQALTQRVREEIIPVAPVTKPTGSANATVNANASVNVKDPKLATALKKSQAGQTLTPDEQKMVASAAMAQQESRLRRAFNVLRESEVQQAQVVLAAQDMVDKIQSMIEDSTEMQFKELPALVDAIRNQIGMDQAVQFQTDATAALSGLVQSLQGTKTNLEQGLGVVTGQAQATPALDAAMTAGAATDMPAPGEEELDLSLDANLPTEEPDDEEPEPAQATQGALGRGRR